MGTETQVEFTDKDGNTHENVKLNNPQMGTETRFRLWSTINKYVVIQLN